MVLGAKSRLHAVFQASTATQQAADALAHQDSQWSAMALDVLQPCLPPASESRDYRTASAYVDSEKESFLTEPVVKELALPQAASQANARSMEYAPAQQAPLW